VSLPGPQTPSGRAMTMMTMLTCAELAFFVHSSHGISESICPSSSSSSSSFQGFFPGPHSRAPPSSSSSSSRDQPTNPISLSVGAATSHNDYFPIQSKYVRQGHSQALLSCTTGVIGQGLQSLGYFSLPACLASPFIPFFISRVITVLCSQLIINRSSFSSSLRSFGGVVGCA
jgi:hypothetical protein